MNFLKAEQGGAGFNWDDIEVGDHHLDHSENFFEQKHIKHERFDVVDGMDDINQLMASTGIDGLSKHGNYPTENKENCYPIKEEEISAAEGKIEPSAPSKTPDTQRETNTTTTPAVERKPLAPSATQDKIKQEMQSPVDERKPLAPSAIHGATNGEARQTANLDLTVESAKPVPNIMCQWSTQKRVVTKTVVSSSTGAIAKAGVMGPPAPHAYNFKDVYQRKKEEAIRKRQEEERKMREFHSRPAPNFSSKHQKLERRTVVHAVTVPVTPMVLKKSRETDEKRKKKMDEWKRQHQPPKFESRPPAVLKEEPFVPKKAVTVLQQRPFSLHSERRALERKAFNQETQQALEEKRKQGEEERKKREEERIKELRRVATFKARPNPFK